MNLALLAAASQAAANIAHANPCAKDCLIPNTELQPEARGHQCFFACMSGRETSGNSRRSEPCQKSTLQQLSALRLQPWHRPKPMRASSNQNDATLTSSSVHQRQGLKEASDAALGRHLICPLPSLCSSVAGARKNLQPPPCQCLSSLPLCCRLSAARLEANASRTKHR